MSEEDM